LDMGGSITESGERGRGSVDGGGGRRGGTQKKKKKTLGPRESHLENQGGKGKGGVC